MFTSRNTDVLFWFVSSALYNLSSLWYIFFLSHHHSSGGIGKLAIPHLHSYLLLYNEILLLAVNQICVYPVTLLCPYSEITGLGLSLHIWLLFLCISYLNGLLVPDLYVLVLLIKIGGGHLNILFSFSPYHTFHKAFLVFVILQTSIHSI